MFQVQVLVGPCPHDDCEAPLVMKKAAPYRYHDTSSSPPKASVIFGIAVATMVLQAQRGASW